MRRAFTWIGLLLGGLVVLFLLVYGVAYAVTESARGRTYDVTVSKLRIDSGDSALVARGRHLTRSIAGCGDCHGEDFGGRVVVDDPMVGYLAGPNLTGGKGSRVGTFSDEDWVRAMRNGVGPDGHALAVMPSDKYWLHKDEDIAAVISYVKTVPRVDRDMGRSSLGPMARILSLFGVIHLYAAEKIDHNGKRTAPPPAGPTAAYGGFIARTNCVSCHGDSLSGGAIPGAPFDWPAASNLTPDTSGLASWGEADFFRVMREGVRPDGRRISDVMPWKMMRNMTDDELRALWNYLRSVPARARGNR